MITAFLLITAASGFTTAPAGADEVKKNLDWLKTRRLVRKLHASGVQHYECNGKEWVAQGPSAILTDEKGKLAAIHYSCESPVLPEPGKPRARVPQWNFFDQSTASVIEAVDKKAAKNAGAVPYLALKIESNGKGPISQADHVLRVETVGGTPPAKDCKTLADSGKWFSANYRADYEFRDSTQEAAHAADSGKPKAGNTDGAVKAQ